MAGCASVHGGAPAVEQADGALAVPAVAGRAVQAGTRRRRLTCQRRGLGCRGPRRRRRGPSWPSGGRPNWGPHSRGTRPLRPFGTKSSWRTRTERRVFSTRRTTTTKPPRASTAGEAAAWDGLARIWRDWGYPGLGLGDAHRAVWADPSSPVTRNTLGTILQLLGKTHEARDQFARAVALDPGAAYAHYNLGVVCADQHQYVAAAEAFERAAALDPSLEIALVRAREARQQALDAASGKGGSHERR